MSRLDELGPLREDEDPYERDNRWMLDAALRFGADKVDFVCLWNGEGGDGPGGAQHMMEEVRKRGGRARLARHEDVVGLTRRRAAPGRPGRQFSEG